MRIYTCLFLLCCSFCSHAEDKDIYWGVAYGAWEFERAFFEDYKLDSFEAKFGQKLNDYISIEGRLGLGLNDDSSVTRSSRYTERVQVEIDNYFSIYLKPRLELADAQMYALLGHTDINTNIVWYYSDFPDSSSDFANPGTDTINSFSYGLGVALPIGDKTSINIEWKKLADVGFGDNYSGLTIGLDFNI